MSIIRLLGLAAVTPQASDALPVDSAAAKVVRAVRLPAGAIRIDGRLDEVPWRTASSRPDFRQKEPVQGGEPSGRTLGGVA